MNVEQAKELCVLAHKGQYRRPREMTKFELIEFNREENTFILESSGNKVIRGDKTFRYEYVVQEPYSNHPIEVADMMETDEEKIVAYLHDVIEDCKDYCLSVLPSSKGGYINNYVIWYNNTIPYEVEPITAEALLLLTKKREETYTEFINRLVREPRHTNYFYYSESSIIRKLATKVKIADITCNLLDNPSENQKKKYRKAMKILLKG